MKIRLNIGVFLALALILLPMASVGADTTANVTVNATPAFVSITVNLTGYSFGVVSASTNYSTGQGQFEITNASTVQTDQTIAMTSDTWSGGVTWAHNDAGTPGEDEVAMYASQDTGVFNIIIKYSSPNYIAENQAATTDYTFEIRMMAPTSFTDGVLKENTVQVSAAAG